MAPVLPAETNPCERPSATVRAPTTMDESCMVLTAAAGSWYELIDRAAGHDLDVRRVGTAEGAAR